MTPLIALAMLVAYLLVSGEVFLATSVHGVFRMSFSGVGPTELRILLAIGAIALLRDPHVDLGGLGRLRLFDFGGLIAIAGMVVALTVNVVRNATALALAVETANAPNREEVGTFSGWTALANCQGTAAAWKPLLTGNGDVVSAFRRTLRRSVRL